MVIPEGDTRGAPAGTAVVLNPRNDKHRTPANKCAGCSVRRCGIPRRGDGMGLSKVVVHRVCLVRTTHLDKAAQDQ